MIRSSLVRTLTAAAAVAVSLALAGCYSDDGYQLPSRAMKELSPEMLSLLAAKNMPKDSPLLVRIFKEESELEVWKQDTSGRYELLKIFPICRWSGDIGPKIKEGDRQAPEGFYPITPGLMNPNSNYYLAINTGFPNAYDRANNYHGAFLMIHGDCSSRGCYAMTDEQIGEIYSLAREAFLGGQKQFQVEAFPFRMTPANLARHRNNPAMPFWKMIKAGDDHFLVSHQEPKVDVCEKRYVFDAAPPNGSTKPLSFSPTGRCPEYQVNPDIAGPALEKQRNDDYQLAQLISRDVPTVPLETGTDGGMNRAFIAKLDTPTYTYDNEGHLHVPPLQPGRLPPEVSAPRPSDASTATGYTVKPANNGGVFAGLFGSKSDAPPSQPAATDGSSHDNSSHGGLFASLFGSKHQDPPPAVDQPDSKPTTAAAPPSRPKAVAQPVAIASKPKPKNEPSQEADASKPAATSAPQATPAPQKQAANGGGLINGAQPVVPSGSFDSRFSGSQ